MGSLFSLLLGCGVLIGLILLVRQAPPGTASHWLDAALAVLLGALVGARVAFVAVSWPYFQFHLGEAFLVSAGGLSWPGALAGAILAVLIVSAVWRNHSGQVGDQLIPLFLPVVVSLWLACFLSGCAYGRPAPISWWNLPIVDEWGQNLPRFPLQILGALTSLVLFWVVERLLPRLPRPGQSSSLILLGLAMQMFALSFLRADPAQTWRGWRLDSWAALGLVAAGLLSCAVCFWPARQALRPVEARPHET